MNGKYGNNLFIRFDKNIGYHYTNIFLNTLKFNYWYTFSKANKKMVNLTTIISPLWTHS